ncbi:MAG TPA: FtsX-like permease family protein, partial [Gemmatimonadales bacterium]|nr:FtsX-like permease family protein [Gemmatimonadales bacterium]
KASLRLALTIAARTSIRSLGRSALIVAMVALPVTGLVGIAVVADSAYNPTAQERITTELGRAEAMLRVTQGSGVGLRQYPTQPSYWTAGNWENQGDFVSPRDALPAGTRILPVTTTTVTAKTATGIGRIDVREGEVWDPSFAGHYDVVEGRAPRSDREVMVTASLLTRLGAKVGDSVALQEGPLAQVTIVGVLDDQTRPAAQEWFFARTGAISGTSAWDDLQNATFYLPNTEVSWEMVRELNEDGITVLSRSVLLNPPADDGSFAWYNPLGTLMSIMAMVAIVAAFAAFEVILLAGAAFTVTARQQQRTLATIASVGAPRRLLFRILAANGIVLGAIGGLLGTAIGVGAAAAYMAITADGSATQYYSFHVPWLGFLAAIAFAVLIGWIASLLPARNTSRFDVVAALRGARKPPAANLRRPVTGLVMLLGGIGITLVGGILMAVLIEAGREYANGHPLQWVPVVMLIAGPILAQLGLVLCGPLLLRAIARMLHGSGLGARLASRDSARNPGRAVPALAAVMTTVFVAVFGMCVAAGSDESMRANYQWAMPLGGIRAPLVGADYSDPEAPIVSGYAHPDAVERAIRDSVEVDRMQLLAGVPDWVPPTEVANSNDEPEAAETEGSADGSEPADVTEAAGSSEVAMLDVPPQNLCPRDPRSPDYFPEAEDLTTSEGRAILEDWRCQHFYPTGFSGPGLDHLFVGDAESLAIILGEEPSAEAKRALASGGAVALYRQYVENDQLSISWWSPGQVERGDRGESRGEPSRTETLDAVVELPEHPLYFGVLITKATADRLGLDYRDSVIIASTKSVPTTQEQDALNLAISALPDNNGEWSRIYASVETGPTDSFAPLAWGLLGLAGLIAIASSAVAIGLARFDGRQDDATLSALGAGRLVRKSFAFWQAVIIAGIGSVLGAATGLVPAWTLGATGLPFAPPWLPIGIAVVALPLVIACGSWLLATRNKVSARRVAIA